MNLDQVAPRIHRWHLVDWRAKSRAAAIHLLLSLLIAGGCALLVFGLWYPGQFREIAGGEGLFLLIISVDVAIGPLLTFAVFDREKGKTHLRLDLTVIAALQLGALTYGLHTVYVARPVAMVFEVDRMRLVTAVDVYRPELSVARTDYRELPLNGPWLLGARPTSTAAERTDALFMGLAGIDTGVRPSFWQPYELSRGAALARSRPLSVLIARYPTRIPELRARLRELRAEESSSRFLPAQARGDWAAVLDKSGEVLGYLPVDGFF